MTLRCYTITFTEYVIPCFLDLKGVLYVKRLFSIVLIGCLLVGLLACIGIAQADESKKAIVAGDVLVVLKEEYRYPAAPYTAADFPELDNIASVSHLSASANDPLVIAVKIQLTDCTEQATYDAIALLKSNPLVKFAEPNYIFSYAVLPDPEPQPDPQPEPDPVPETQPETAVSIVGDLDGDGIVDAKDALQVLQYAVGNEMITAEKLIFADVDGNGVCNAVDALCILQMAVGVYPVA